MTPTNELHNLLFSTTDLIGYLKTAIIGQSKTMIALIGHFKAIALPLLVS